MQTIQVTENLSLMPVRYSMECAEQLAELCSDPRVANDYNIHLEFGGMVQLYSRPEQGLSRLEDYGNGATNLERPYPNWPTKVGYLAMRRVAKKQESLAGFVWAVPSTACIDVIDPVGKPATQEIEAINFSFFVHPAMQGEGIGRQLHRQITHDIDQRTSRMSADGKVAPIRTTGVRPNNQNSKKLVEQDMSVVGQDRFWWNGLLYNYYAVTSEVSTIRAHAQAAYDATRS